MYDVAIVGAGVTGSYVAYRLAGLGYTVAVLEEHEYIGEPAKCTGIVGVECVERFPLFDGTVLSAVRAATVFSPSGKELHLRRQSTQAYVVDRPAFDRALADRARRRGADYFIGVKIDDIAPGDEVVTLTANGLSPLKARTAVVATGCGSTITRKLGLGRAGDMIMGAQAEVEIDGVDQIEVYVDQSLAPGFFAWLVPTRAHRALAGLFSRGDTARCFRSFLGQLLAQGKVLSTAATPTFGAIPLQTISRSYLRRALVVGDAAGHVKPTSGGGVYYGLLCAEIAADTLDRALSAGDCSEAMLSDYERRWRTSLGRELSIDRFARRVYEKMDNRQIEALFGIIRSNGIHEALLGSPELSFDWHGDVIVKGLKHFAPWRRLLSPVESREKPHAVW